MMTMSADSSRRLYRDGDRAILGGVCAGLARYLGFNLRVTRILAFIAFLMAMPITVVGYLAAVFLIPSVSYKDFGVGNKRTARGRHKASHKKETEYSPRSSYADVIQRRCKALDARLAILEKHVTSTRFQIDQELSRL
jgi:phage shock protein C